MNSWQIHLQHFRKKNPRLSLREAMVKAKKTYKGSGISFSKNKVKKLKPSPAQEDIDNQRDFAELRRLISKEKPKKVPKRYSTNLGVIPEQNRNFSMGSPRGKVKKAFSAKGLSSSKVKPLSPQEIKAYLEKESEYKKRLIANLEKIKVKRGFGKKSAKSKALYRAREREPVYKYNKKVSKELGKYITHKDVVKHIIDPYRLPPTKEDARIAYNAIMNKIAYILPRRLEDFDFQAKLNKMLHNVWSDEPTIAMLKIRLANDYYNKHIDQVSK